jgi:predicted Zn-ribbon and HTH transcriptional regulator
MMTRKEKVKHLHDVKEISAKEISNMLNVSLSTVYNDLSEIRKERDTKRRISEDLYIENKRLKDCEFDREDFENFLEDLEDLAVYLKSVQKPQEKEVTAIRVMSVDFDMVETELFSTWIKGSKFPGGLAANIKALTSDEDVFGVHVDVMIKKEWRRLW